MKHTALLAALLVIASGTTALAPVPLPETPNIPLPAAPQEGGQLLDAIGRAIADTLDEPTCVAEDQTPGMGGQKLSCDFICDEKAIISVYAEADDEDAHVTGTATCDDGYAHCSNKKSCNDRDEIPTSGADEGKCTADSDETWDSGFYVKCSADPAESGREPDPSRICLIKDNPPYPDICLPETYEGPLPAEPCTLAEGAGDACADGLGDCLTYLAEATPEDRSCLGDAWQAVFDGAAGIREGADATVAYIFDDIVRGLVCEGLECVPFVEELR